MILAQQVTVFDGISQFSARPAVIELHDDRFVLAKWDEATRQKTEVVFDVPLSELEVGGSMAMLTFMANGVKKRVDFSFGARAALLGGAAGLIVSDALAKSSGMEAWLHEFQQRGVRVKFLRTSKIVLWSVLGTVAAVAILFIAIVLGAF